MALKDHNLRDKLDLLSIVSKMTCKGQLFLKQLLLDSVYPMALRMV